MKSPFSARGYDSLLSVPQSRFIERYIIASALAFIAVLLRGILDPILGHVAFYVTVYMAVAVCAVLCGVGPAIFSALVGFLGILYWFVDPRNSLSVSRQSEIRGIVGFFLVCTVLVALGAANRRKQLRLNCTITELTAEACERVRAEQDLQRAYGDLEQRVKDRTAELSQALARLTSEVDVRKQAENQLRRLTVRLMALQDEERRRIARDLHDTTGQTLTALKITVASIQQLGIEVPGLTRLLDDLNAITDEALKEIRTTSYLLHPPLLDEAGFASAAHWFVEGFAKRSSVQVECDIAVPAERLSKEHELVLFRVLQESLTNVHRHSGAGKVSVVATENGNVFGLRIHDDGHGIETQRLEQLQQASSGVGVGIAGMRERVRQLGGTLEIESHKSGTTITVALPLIRGSSLGVSA
jgi:signal transduction histidine kinase